MISIKWLNANPILDLKTANCLTKRLKPASDYMSDELFLATLKAEHSTLRFMSIMITDDNCPNTKASQIVRHTLEHTQPVMSSARPDWTGKERDYTKSRWLAVKFTPIGLIRMMEERLCTQAEQATIQWAEEIREVLLNHDDRYLALIGDLCNTICYKHGYCKLAKNCWGFIGGLHGV